MFKEPNKSCYFNLMAGGGCDVSMADLHQTRPDPNAGIDAVGVAIFGLCCRYHSRRCDGCLRGKRHDGCECPCVAPSRALGIVLPH